LFLFFWYAEVELDKGGGRDGVVSGADFFLSMDVVADGHFALFMTFQNLRYYSTPILKGPRMPPRGGVNRRF